MRKAGFRPSGTRGAGKRLWRSSKVGGRRSLALPASGGRPLGASRARARWRPFPAAGTEGSRRWIRAPATDRQGVSIAHPRRREKRQKMSLDQASEHGRAGSSASATRGAAGRRVERSLRGATTGWATLGLGKREWELNLGDAGSCRQMGGAQPRQRRRGLGDAWPQTSRSPTTWRRAARGSAVAGVHTCSTMERVQARTPARSATGAQLPTHARRG